MPAFYRSLLLPMAIAGICCARPPQEAAPPFTITISAKQGVVQAGSEIAFTVSLKNVSDHQIAIYVENRRAAELEGYLIEVRDAEGRIQRTSHYYWSLGRFGGGMRPPALVPRGSEQDYSDNRADGPDEGSGANAGLWPGRSNEARFDLNKLYAPLQPGKYTVQVQRIDPESKAAVKSNVVTLEVIK
jgi:hypothetical protein